MQNQLSLVSGFLLIITSLMFAQQAVATEVFQVNGIAIAGYDTVAYFKQGKAVLGDPKIIHEWNGATWQFNSEDNRTAFISEPERFAPQYGGFCALSATTEELAPGNPLVWNIVDDKLYLNASSAVEQIWLNRSHELIEKANINWPGS